VNDEAPLWFDESGRGEWDEHYVIKLWSVAWVVMLDQAIAYCVICGWSSPPQADLPEADRCLTDHVESPDHIRKIQ
jgi:hypothetical protein